MKFTKLAEKKLKLILPGPREKLEAEFLRLYIISAIPELHWNHGLNRTDTLEFCRRCSEFGLEILGLEISPESPFPCDSYCQEHYCQEYTWEWIKQPLKELESLCIDGWIVPVVDVPESVFLKYLY